MTCLICNRTLQQNISLKELLSFQRFEETTVCLPCLGKFTHIQPGACCPGCSRPQIDQEHCLDCQKWLKKYPSEIVQHKAFYHYDDRLKDWLHQYKILGDIRYARIFTADLKTFYRKHANYLFVPLPISTTSMAERGFNQCELLLQEAGIPYQNLIKHQIDGKKQAEKNRSERLRSDQPFILANKPDNPDKPIMLVDDLYTTGRTMLHAKELLASSGFQQLSSISIGR